MIENHATLSQYENKLKLNMADVQAHFKRINIYRNEVNGQS